MGEDQSINVKALTSSNFLSKSDSQVIILILLHCRGTKLFLQNIEFWNDVPATRLTHQHAFPVLGDSATQTQLCTIHNHCCHSGDRD